jgi:hypothetical protein
LGGSPNSDEGHTLWYSLYVRTLWSKGKGRDLKSRSDEQAPKPEASPAKGRAARATGGTNTESSLCAIGGFNFILFWNFNRNQTENDRYGQKSNFWLLAKCLKIYSFFAFAFKVCKKCNKDPKIFSLSYGHLFNPASTNLKSA